MSFQERLKRINSGTQYEHADVIGHATQRAYTRRFGDKAKKPKRTFLDNVMAVVSFLCGLIAFLLGRVAYFHLSRVEGLPDAFYDLGARGMVLFGFVAAGILAAVFHLSTRKRLPALLLGCALMHYGEAAMATNAPDFWSELFSPDYAAEMAEKGRDYRLTPTG
ncbi:MAG: hypothetical protein R3E44_15900 [Paracoccaceae bacterium]